MPDRARRPADSHSRPTTAAAGSSVICRHPAPAHTAILCRLACSAAAVRSGRVSSPFGRREDPFTGEASLHSGLDIAAAQGSPISAAFYGTVTKVGEDEIAGKYIRLTHADGLETFYCHCSEILAPMNAVIRQGETIALVGSTGMATGPHLHFEVRINGLKYDPARLLFSGNI